MKKSLVLPGWMTTIKFYSGNMYISIGSVDARSLSAEYVVGLSMGALVVLKNIEKIEGKVILVNPLLPKRSLVAWFFRWLQYISHEGLFLQRQKFTVNPLVYIRASIQHILLLRLDFSDVFSYLPKDKVIVIRGKNDRFFCDQEAADYLASKGIRVIGVETGHNWSKEIEEVLNSF